MNASDFHIQVRALFHELAELLEPEQRDRLAKSDAAPEVIAEVRELLAIAAREATPGPLGESRLGGWNERLLEGADREQADELIGQHVDGYTIRGVLGVGGMGTVFVAEQTVPIERTVALKLIKLGMDSRTIVSRFEAERQALALMNHEGIARVYDCGTTERGQPYFVMELVEGLPIDRFCDDNALSLEDRLLLIRQTCDAVHHAHQKGVVHRDLKPGNVLVSRERDRLRVKIIDFGLAKAMGRELVEATLFTEVGQVVGTPEYMAPEQADTANPDVDTRADVYSIGVLMFQLLVGELPFSAAELRRDLLRADGDVTLRRDPPKPSARVAPGRGAASSTLRRALRSDLDWIVLKAMDPDRDRRYDSAAALAEDIERFTNYEPLVAGPPSTSYRVQKLARRYRTQLIVVVVVVTALAIGGAIALSQWLRADQKVEEFDQLAGVVKHEVAVAEARELFPAWPPLLDELRTWIEERWKPLESVRPQLRRSIASLREQALAWSEADRDRDFGNHPQAHELEVLRLELDAMRYAQSIRNGETAFEPADISGIKIAPRSGGVYGLAWRRVAPAWSERSIWGEEAEGLAFARMLVKHVAAGRTPVSQCSAYKTLAFACLANAQDQEAVAAAERAVATSSGSARHVRSHRDDLARIRRIVDNPAAEFAQLRDAERALSAEVGMRRTWRFADSDESQQFLHETLMELSGRINALESEELEQVKRRVRWAESIGKLTRQHPDAACSWDTVRTVLTESDRYASASIELEDRDIYGLVPLGLNPVTGLLEFYHLRSAWDGVSDPHDLPIPRHADDGRIEVGKDTGIVFVLLPGATFTMGSQSGDPSSPNYDPVARPEEKPHRLRVGPFFLARHELTKAQWLRLVAGQGIERRPSYVAPGITTGNRNATWADPVEQVSWDDCKTLGRWHRLTLPTEAQWEFACRAGSSERWPWPAEHLEEFANIADQSAIGNATWDLHEGNDGYITHAPVGAFAANAFGLHDMIGNVSEWCLDRESSYERSFRAGDGLRLLMSAGGETRLRIMRGGSYRSPVSRARSATRASQLQDARSIRVGVRFARSIRPWIERSEELSPTVRTR